MKSLDVFEVLRVYSYPYKVGQAQFDRQSHFTRSLHHHNFSIENTDVEEK